jgi:hypothetical protein
MKNIWLIGICMAVVGYVDAQQVSVHNTTKLPIKIRYSKLVESHDKRASSKHGDSVLISYTLKLEPQTTVQLGDAKRTMIDRVSVFRKPFIVPSVDKLSLKKALSKVRVYAHDKITLVFSLSGDGKKIYTVAESERVPTVPPTTIEQAVTKLRPTHSVPGR